MKTTTALTSDYIHEHPYIKHCLKKGLLNYSSLARHIAKDLHIEKKSSKEAIIIAARRLHEKLKKSPTYEKDAMTLLKESDITIKNKVTVYTLAKSLHDIDYLRREKQPGLFYLLEGSDSYTLIMQQKYALMIDQKLKPTAIKKKKDLMMITLHSPQQVDAVPGVISYLTSLFSQNGINIHEFISCWTDTIFLVDVKDAESVLSFLNWGGDNTKNETFKY